MDPKPRSKFSAIAEILVSDYNIDKEIEEGLKRSEEMLRKQKITRAGLLIVGLMVLIIGFTLVASGAFNSRPKTILSPPAPVLSPLPVTMLAQSKTLIPTLVATATERKVPTITSIPPTATIPAPDKSLEYFTDVQVTYFDNFENPNRGGWWLDGGKITNGLLEVQGKNWSGVGRDVERTFSEGEGVILDFTYSKGSTFEMLFAHGVWQTDPYKRFGVYVSGGSAQANLFQGKNGLGFNNLHGNFSPKPDTAYCVLMAVLPDGEFLGLIWNPSDPSKTISYREKMGKTWANLNWTFGMGSDGGMIKFDNYKEIEFTGVK